MRNLKLLEKYQPPPRHQEKKISIYKKTKKTSLLVKLSTTLKLPQLYEKASNPPLEKFSISQKALTPSEKFSTPLK